MRSVIATFVFAALFSIVLAVDPVPYLAGGSGGSLASGSGTRAIAFSSVTSSSQISVSADMKTFTVLSGGDLTVSVTASGIAVTGCTGFNAAGVILDRTDTATSVAGASQSAGTFDWGPALVSGGPAQPNTFSFYAPSGSTYQVQGVACPSGTVSVTAATVGFTLIVV